LADWSIAALGILIVLGGLAVAALLGTPDAPQDTASAPPAASTAPPPDPGTAGVAGQPRQEQAERTPAAPQARATREPGSSTAAQASQPQASTTAQSLDSRPGAAPQTPGAAPQAPPVTTSQAPAQPQAPAQAQAPSSAQAPAQPRAPVHGGHAAASPEGDVNAGRQSFRKCQACHSLDAGKNLIGPSLAGVVGKPAGQSSGYNYSPAMKDSGVVWNAQNLNAFMAAPQRLVPKTKMAFPGIASDSERSNIVAFLASASQAPAGAAPAQAQASPPAARAVPPPPAAQQPGTGQPTGQPGAVSYIPDVRFTIRSGIAEGRMVYLGVGGSIDGQVNPILSASEGQVVQVTLLNGEGAEHDVVFPDFNAGSPRIVGRGTSTVMVFRATKSGDFLYYCSVAGHRQAGMEGQFLVSPRPPEQVVVEADIGHLPTDVPPPIGKRDPQTIRVDLLAVELEARLSEGTTYGFWTFNGRVPGPMLRARVGDTLDVHVTNSKDSAYIHSVDFHAATGPGGGAASTQVNPGHTKSFKFKALVPGLYVYHCATPMVAHHIANGMYGLILVEPAEGLPPVDHEFYVMQGEIYTQDSFGQRGRQEFSVEKLLNERPEYFVFNGSVGALSKLHPLKAKVGETVRIYFGVGGPNFTSSFHVIGEIFDRVYSFADLQSPPLRGVQTITVPPGGAAVVEFKVDVPGNYILVDHALSRAERGLVGILQVAGPPNPEIYDGKVEEGSGH
jgi:nitrite reductase (NO-forming)